MAEIILLFPANIITLSRLPMYLVLFLFPTYHYTGVILFAISIFLDIFDGIVARKMKQTSLLGMHLDSLVDKVGTMILLMLLTTVQPDKSVFYYTVIIISFFANWIFNCFYIISGGDVGNAVMKFFYSEPFLTYCVLGKDYFYLALYHYYKQASDGVDHFAGVYLVLIATAPALILYYTFDIIKIYTAVRGISAIDIENRKHLKNK